jgi:hypothetical protein
MNVQSAKTDRINYAIPWIVGLMMYSEHASYIFLGLEPISAISLSFDSSKIEKGVLSFEAFKQAYVSQVGSGTNFGDIFIL